MNRNLHRLGVLRRWALLFCLLFLGSGSCFGQADFPRTLAWPPDSPTPKFVLAEYQASGIVNGHGIFVSDVTAQNRSDQPVPKSVFTVFVMDKDGVRIGRGLFRLPDIGPKHTERSQIHFSVAGTPVSMKLLSGRTIPLKWSRRPPAQT
jgi:hypothetical protein